MLTASPVHAGTGTIQDVQHVVILMQENRSFDHYFGTLRGVRGFSDPNILVFQNGSSDLFQPNGGTNFVLPFPVTRPNISDVDHSEESGLDAWNKGWWNDWVHDKGPGTMAYYTRTNLPFYYALADAYTICDANFCSFMGPTFPNRIYLFTGTVDPGGTGGGPVLGNSVPTNGFTWTTYPERLQAAGVDWKVYRPPGDWFGDALQWFAQYMNAKAGDPLHDRGLATVNDVVAAFSADVTNGVLPQVSWIIPPYNLSEHPSYSPEDGETFVSQLLKTLAANPSVFNSTVFVITYDENGGFFDHVPSPVPPPGTTNESVYGQPLGPGVRVPMFIISPWTRGGKVCSQVFDHTSVIRFLEAWTGVQEPNISAWRRQICGDLTSAFDFANPDYSIPNLPGAIGTYPALPSAQTVPVQESGTKTACPLPYQPDAYCHTDCASNRLCIILTNAGSASVHYAIYPNAHHTDDPRQYDVPPGGAVNDFFAISSFALGQYDFTCYGPNGFQRRFAGNLTNDGYPIEVVSLVDTNAGGVTLTLQNPDSTPANFTVTDNYGFGGPWTFSLPPATATNSTFPIVGGNNGWYKFTVTADTDTNFVRRLAGHVETGSFSPTEVPTNYLSGPVINSINDLIAHLIAQYSLTTAGTNALALTVGTYGNSCALIYPGWASNYVVESSVNLDLASWTQLNATITMVSNCNVIILSETNVCGFFRLRL